MYVRYTHIHNERWSRGIDWSCNSSFKHFICLSHNKYVYFRVFDELYIQIWLHILHIIEEHVKKVGVLALRPFQTFGIVPVDERRDDANVDILVGSERTVYILPTAKNRLCDEFWSK